jgi:hypothetical protein
MCATVCPSQALYYGTREEMERLRPMSMPVNQFQFGNQRITTQVLMMVPRGPFVRPPLVDVTAAMDDTPRARAITLTPVDDPFAGVEV